MKCNRIYEESHFKSVQVIQIFNKDNMTDQKNKSMNYFPKVICYMVIQGQCHMLDLCLEL